MKFATAFSLTLLILAVQVHAIEHLVISEVLYDPDGADSGKEFVELYNPDSTPKSLSGYILESGNGAGVNEWTTEWTGTEQTITAGGFFLIGEADVEPAPDFSTSLDLQNSPDAVRLLDNNGNIVDLVGYGTGFFSADYYESSPAQITDVGKSLQRIQWQDSDDNSADFYQASPNPENSIDENSALIETNISVINSIPVINSINLSVSTFSNDGTSQINVKVTASDLNGAENIENVKVFIEGIESEMEKAGDINITTAFFEANISISSLSTGTHILVAVVSDSESNNSMSSEFEIYAITAFEIESEGMQFNASAGAEQNKSVIIKNTGNTPLNILVLGTDFSLGDNTMEVSSISISVDNENFETLSSEPEEKVSGILPNESKALLFRIRIPLGTMPGKYNGKIEISAV